MKKIKHLFYTLIPTVVLLGSVELVFRAFYSFKPEFVTAPLPDEFRGLIQPHEDLFWVMRPNAVVNEPNGEVVRINAQGFRGPDLERKRPNDYRILSLGESSTFGAGVGNDATYSALLENNLNQQIAEPKNVQVLNCGVSAYSSYQGIKFFELYGQDLQPDMVMLYFEINDYMPSTLRNQGLNETNAYLTDAQYHNSKTKNLARNIISSSKFLTFLHYRYAAYKIKKMGGDQLKNPFVDIGIQNPILNIGRLAVEKEGKMVHSSLNEYNLGRRVNENERLANLEGFLAMCRRMDIPLVIIHPAYLNTKLHQCVLTDFCSANNVPVFEAYHSLHPDPNTRHAMFFDNMHPNHEGHQRLAQDLSKFIIPLVTNK